MVWLNGEMPLFRASILAVGSELTSGQVPNSNSTWLSERLTDLGFEVALHLACPDERSLLKAGLEFVSHHSHWIFVTGGLGPTSDDFTREIVADHLGVKLEFDAVAFGDVQAKLAARNVIATESQKRQCWFPHGSCRLSNRAGTADAFSLRSRGRSYWVLPGPPKEIEALWQDHLLRDLENIVPEEQRLRLFSWITRGKPEAEIGEIVDAALKGSGLATGFRAAKPIIETKVWVPGSRMNEALSWLKKVDEALKPWVELRPPLERLD